MTTDRPRMTVLSVLRSGGVYTPEWVYRLRAGVARHLPLPHRFVCLSDVPLNGVERVPLHADWPGWWSKIALFRPGLVDGRALYLDLDTVVTGDLAPLAAYDGERAVLRDFYQPRMIGTGVMLWQGDAMRRVWDVFTADPPGWIMRNLARMDAFIRRRVGSHDYVQDLWPGLAVSYKRHCRDGVPDGAALICMHGRPKMHELPADDPVRRAWEATDTLEAA